MSYGPVMVSAFGPLFSNRVYPLVPPDSPGREPMMIYQKIGGAPSYLSEGDLADKRNSRVQVYVWSTSASVTSNLVDQLLQIAAKHKYMVPITEPTEEYEEVLKLYGSRVDLSLWHPY